MKVLIVCFGLVALSAALPVKSSLSDEAVTADFGVLSLLLSSFPSFPCGILLLASSSFWFALGLGLGFTTRFLCVLCTQCRCSTMPDWRIILIWRIILVQEFFSRPPSSSLSLVSALLSSHAPLIFAVHSEKTAGFNRLPRAGWTETCNSSDRTAWCQILGSFLLSYYPVMRVNDVASWTAGENRRFRGMTIGEVIIFPFPLCTFPLCRTLSSVEMLCPPWSLDLFKPLSLQNTHSLAS